MAGIRISQLGAFAGVGATAATIFAMVDPADPTQAPSGTTKRMTAAQVVGNYQGPAVNLPNATVIIGADPGGTARFRVGGDAQISANLGVGGTVSAPFGSIPTLQVSTSLTAGAVAVSGQLSVPNGPVIIGTDPGGGQLFRVGGTANISQGITDGGSLSVAGAATLSGGVSVTGTAGLTGPVVIGTDPGGTQLLRVGGAAIVSGAFTTQSVTTSGFVQLSIGQQIQWGGATDALTVNPAGTMLFYTANAVRLTLNPDGSAVIGPDPGTTALLRVGGAMQVNGIITLARAGLAVAVLNNTDSASIAAIQFQRGGTLRAYMGADSGSMITGSAPNDFFLRAEAGGAIRLAINGTTPAFIISSTGVISFPTLGGAAQTLSAGAADSAGAGFRQLRIPN